MVNSNDKKRARLNVITHLLGQIPYEDTTPEKIELPPRQPDGGYVRPPITDQTFVPEVFSTSILAQVDLTLALPAEAYAEQLPAKQAAVSLLMRQVLAQKRPVVIVFEGSDPAGQGDGIKRLTEKLDPRFYVVYRNAPAEGEDKVRRISIGSGAACPAAAMPPSSTAVGTSVCWRSVWTASALRANGTAPTESWTSLSAN